MQVFVESVVNQPGSIYSLLSPWAVGEFPLTRDNDGLVFWMEQKILWQYSESC